MSHHPFFRSLIGMFQQQSSSASLPSAKDLVQPAATALLFHGLRPVRHPRVQSQALSGMLLDPPLVQKTDRDNDNSCF